MALSRSRPYRRKRLGGHQNSKVLVQLHWYVFECLFFARRTVSCTRIFAAAAADEAKIINRVTQAQRSAFRSTAVGSMPRLRDRFLLRGPNGLREWT